MNIAERIKNARVAKHYTQAGGVGAISTATAPTQTVQAVSKHSYRWHWVKVKRDVKVYRLRFPLYRAPKFDSIMEKGSDAEVRYVPNHYYFELKGYAKIDDDFIIHFL